ncbi:DUF3413 domain-containing protein [Paraferrimonas sp. SM1919]|uniref:DUF3413 domain-containing protein n=1 Tax=Paraferrimonas sp. SM1919 TaxID=2662263 RepID=UPI0013D63024|nr:DUF3413 domain-containing protein [Paraferrimonas sp. SM1919]
MGNDKVRVKDKTSLLINWGHWFCVFNGFLAVLIASRYVIAMGSPTDFIGWLYLLTTGLSHFIFLAFIVYVVVIFPITLLLPFSTILRGTAAVISTLALSLLMFDVAVFNEYGVHLNPFSLSVASSDLPSLLEGPKPIFLPLAILVLELVAANWLWKRIRPIQKKNMGMKVVTFVGACFVLSHGIHIWADAYNVNSVTRQDPMFPLSYPATAQQLFKDYGVATNPNDSQAQASQLLNYPLTPMQCQPQQLHNITLVIVDNWRSDLVSVDSMPNYSRFANNNHQWLNHYSGGPSVQSGLFSILYGLQGSYQEALESDLQAPLLTQVTKTLGYQNHYWSSGHSEQNFNYAFADISKHIVDEQKNLAENDIVIVTNYLQQQHPSTAQFNIIRLSGLSSYDVPAGQVGIAAVEAPSGYNTAKKVLFNQYRQALFALDKQLQRIIDAEPNSTLIITGINGMLFTVNSYDHEHDLSPESLAVPLAWSKGSDVKNTFPQFSSHHSVVPTLMSKLLKCNNPSSDYSSGGDLFDQDSKPWWFAGNRHNFAIYQNNKITVIDRHGRFETLDYQFNPIEQELDAPQLIKMMREGKRFYRN